MTVVKIYLQLFLWSVNFSLVIYGQLPFLQQLPRYQTFEELELKLKSIAVLHRQRTHLYSIGSSVEGRTLWVLALANKQPAKHILLRAETKLISTMHGDERQKQRKRLRFESEFSGFIPYERCSLTAGNFSSNAMARPDRVDLISPTPDDATFQYLALKYSRNHKKMHLGLGCDRFFPNGITNGASWYHFIGGMQDYNYGKGVMALTIELSCCKFPPASLLEIQWQDNKNAFVEFLIQANQGVRGLVLDKAGRPVSKAMLTIEGRNSVFYTTEKGEFWRILLPGKYVLKVLQPGAIETWRYAIDVLKYQPGQNIRAYKVVLP